MKCKIKIQRCLSPFTCCCTPHFKKSPEDDYLYSSSGDLLMIILFHFHLFSILPSSKTLPIIGTKLVQNRLFGTDNSSETLIFLAFFNQHFASWGKVSPTIHIYSYSFKSFILLTFPNFILIHITSGKKQICCQSVVFAAFLLSGFTPRTLLKRYPTLISC